MLRESAKHPTTTEPGFERQTYTIEEAARILGIGRASGYEAARTGALPTLQIGRRRVVPRAALSKLLTGEP